MENGFGDMNTKFADINTKFVEVNTQIESVKSDFKLTKWQIHLLLYRPVTFGRQQSGWVSVRPFFLCLSASEQDYPVVKTVSIFLNKLYIIHLNFSSWTPLNSIAIYSSGRVSREAAEYAGSWGISSCQESLSGPKTVVSNRARPNLTGRYSIWRGISGELLIILMYEVYSIGTGYYMARQRPRGSIILSARYGA